MNTIFTFLFQFISDSNFDDLADVCSINCLGSD